MTIHAFESWSLDFILQSTSKWTDFKDIYQNVEQSLSGKSISLICLTVQTYVQAHGVNEAALATLALNHAGYSEPSWLFPLASFQPAQNFSKCKLPSTSFIFTKVAPTPTKEQKTSFAGVGGLYLWPYPRIIAPYKAQQSNKGMETDTDFVKTWRERGGDGAAQGA